MQCRNRFGGVVSSAQCHAEEAGTGMHDCLPFPLTPVALLTESARERERDDDELV